jgi:hypothetical protein
MNNLNITHPQERLELVQQLKDKIQKEINELIEHYFNYRPKTKFEFINISFIVTVINEMQKYIDLPYAFLEIYNSSYYRLDKLYLKIMLEDNFNITMKYIFMCQDNGNALISINDEMFSSFEFIDVFDSTAYKEKHKEEA